MARAFADLPAATQAGMLSKDSRFAAFIEKKHGFPGEPARFIRGFCRVDSRADLNTDADARARFDALRTEFDAFTGKIPPQR